jgi:serine/threonine-protein kinase RsbW
MTAAAYTTLTRFPQIASCTFPGRDDTISVVRAWLRDLIGDHDDVLLCASELATNAVRYSRSRGATFNVVVGWDSRTVQVIVLDDGPLPQPPADTDERDGGRGLFIINQLAAACSWDNDAHGRIAWFRINL